MQPPQELWPTGWEFLPNPTWRGHVLADWWWSQRWHQHKGIFLFSAAQDKAWRMDGSCEKCISLVPAGESESAAGSRSQDAEGNLGRPSGRWRSWTFIRKKPTFFPSEFPSHLRDFVLEVKKSLRAFNIFCLRGAGLQPGRGETEWVVRVASFLSASLPKKAHHSEWEARNAPINNMQGEVRLQLR